MKWMVVLVVLACMPGHGLARDGQAQAARNGVEPVQSVPRDGGLPPVRWAHRERAALWTRSALDALRGHGAALVTDVPRDIAAWCPGYTQAGQRGRRAFWVGFLSALAKHESTYRAQAVGGGGRYFGLLQIAPATARGYECRATSGEALRYGPDNLSCAIRIMAHTVTRDGVVSAGMRGVAADWGPLHSKSKRRDMQDWLREQRYCRQLPATRPRARPAGERQVQGG
ncbi:transglycosylase SLT domain-containing protein [Roseovarius sp. D22-M7]|uniref:transglycosylase SLT domain-containing protein n=1 Tax=Roseovarius sp. D22-M7 TaxID=3127116 RepID=UPI00301009DA